MSRLVARVLLSMFPFPLGVALYALVLALAESAFHPLVYPSREQYCFLTADVVTWCAMAAYWCLLWRTSIRWTSRRVGLTLTAAVLAPMVGGFISVLIGTAGSGKGPGVDFILFLGGVVTIVLWLFATVFIWRETAAERTARVAPGGTAVVTCPTCGYNLTGLGDARCPDCGSRFTLDELLAAQPARVTAAAVAELE